MNDIEMSQLNDKLLSRARLQVTEVLSVLSSQQSDTLCHVCLRSLQSFPLMQSVLSHLRVMMKVRDDQCTVAVIFRAQAHTH